MKKTILIIGLALASLTMSAQTVGTVKATAAVNPANVYKNSSSTDTSFIYWSWMGQVIIDSTFRGCKEFNSYFDSRRDDTTLTVTTPKDSVVAHIIKWYATQPCNERDLPVIKE